MLDNRYRAFSKECAQRLRNVTSILERRKERCTDKTEASIDVYADAELSALTVDQLYNLYDRWPERHKKRTLEGREQMTFYFEGRIVRELENRKALTESEKLKRDYCMMTYRNELENMSFIFSVPVGNQTKLTASDKDNNTFELSSLINHYGNFKTIAERELLVEYVDIALDRMQLADNNAALIGVAAEIVELGRRDVVKVPTWTVDFLEKAIDKARKDTRVSESELVIPLLTLALKARAPKLEREAQRIINRCYKSAFDDSLELTKRVESLHTAITCSDYVTRFSIRKATTIWNELATQTLSKGTNPSSKQAFQLLEVAKECVAYAPVCTESKDKLKQILVEMAAADCPMSQA